MKTKKVMANKVVVLDNEVHDELKNLSKENGMILSALANTIVLLGIEAYKKSKK